MFKLAKPFFIMVETPLHAGSGNDLGIVDMPIQRERHTDFPKIEGSGLKGSVREAFEEIQVADKKSELPDFIKNQDQFDIAVHLAFGYDGGGKEKFSPEVMKFFKDDKKQQFSGALGFTDARILLFPVKSMKGVFAWITCPKVLEKFKKDLELCNVKKELFNGTIPKKNTVSNLGKLGIQGKIILEEYTFEVKMEKSTKVFAEKLSKLLNIEEIKSKLVVLSDDDFKDFVNLSTEVITRTKIDNKTGTVQSGALFTEEYLPCETILYSLALTTPIFQSDKNDKGVFKKENGKTNNKTEEQKVMDFFTNGLPKVMQIGGNATIGKGIVRMKIFDEEQKNGG